MDELKRKNKFWLELKLAIQTIHTVTLLKRKTHQLQPVKHQNYHPSSHIRLPEVSKQKVEKSNAKTLKEALFNNPTVTSNIIQYLKHIFAKI